MINWKLTQENLNRAGQKLTVDGVMGPRTVKALLDVITRSDIPVEVAKAMVHTINTYAINTPRRLASFVANTAHESGNFKVTTENLNYSAKGLMATWPKRFPTLSVANAYARQPEQIANKVYADRMGNGNEASGDGWRYRGAGYIQLTGKSNFTIFAGWVGMPLSEAVAFARTPEGAMRSAVHFWLSNSLNRYADENNITGLRKAINGGTLGLSEVREMYNRGLSVLA